MLVPPLTVTAVAHLIGAFRAIFGDVAFAFTLVAVPFRNGDKSAFYPLFASVVFGPGLIARRIGGVR